MGQEILERRQFGSSMLTVPPIAIGCAPMGNMEETFLYGVSEADAIATIREGLAGPIDYIDTAALYGDGESERRIGLALAEIGGMPDRGVLQTKQGRDPVTGDYSGDTVKRRMERSLSLLGVDHLDIVYLHDAEWTTFENAMAPDGPVAVLQSYKDQGVVDYLGVAAGPNAIELQYVETGLFDAVITHNRFTLLSRIADPLIGEAYRRGMAVLNAAPYGSGLLAKGPQAYPRYAYQEASEAMLARTVALQEICERYSVPLAAAALQFSMLDPRITVTIVGMSRPERLQQTIDLATIDIPAGLWAEIDALPQIQDTDPEADRWS